MTFGMILLASAVAGGTFAIAKSKNANNGTAALAGVAAGAGTAVVLPVLMALLGWVLILGLISIPAAGVYLYMSKGKDQKALPPGS
jgi:hypothetical protein